MLVTTPHGSTVIRADPEPYRLITDLAKDNDMHDRHKPLIAQLRAALDAGVTEIDDLLRTLAGPGEVIGSADPTWRPRAAVGGAELDLSSRTAFNGDLWLARYCVTLERGVYLASCLGLKAFEAVLGTTLAKASTCSPARLAERMDEVHRDQTGSVWHDGRRYLKAVDGWTDWFARQIRPVVGPSPGSPVAVENRLITVRLRPRCAGRTSTAPSTPRSARPRSIVGR